MVNDKWEHSRWLCKCDCGKEKTVRGDHLKSGETQSCGCLQKEIISTIKTIHGHKKNGKETEFYKSWADMIQRCTNPDHKSYHNYGGKGITVCKRWMKFKNFLEDMVEGWESGLTLERTDNKKGYYKLNCRWATPKEQARNRRGNLYVSYREENRLLVELCEEHNMPYKTVWKRIYKLGWSLEEALTIPVGQRRKKS